jgi:hypothetical protein
MRKQLILATASLVATLSLAGIAFAAGGDIRVQATPDDEILGSADGEAGYLAWAQNGRSHHHHYDAFVSLNGAPRVRVNADGTIGFAGSADGGVLAYQEISGGTHSDIRFFDLATRARSTPAGVNSRAWEWSPTISGEWLLYGRESRIKNEVILHNLTTGETRTLAQTSPSRTATPGQVNGDYATFMTCGKVLCNVSRYRISTGTTSAAPNRRRRFQYAPSISADGTLYYASSEPACGADVQIRKLVPGASTPTILLAIPAGKDLVTTFADDRADGSTDVYHERGPCGGTYPSRNLYKLVDPA